jgi:hypothetical protein
MPVYPAGIDIFPLITRHASHHRSLSLAIMIPRMIADQDSFCTHDRRESDGNVLSHSKSVICPKDVLFYRLSSPKFVPQKRNWLISLIGISIMAIRKKPTKP